MDRKLATTAITSALMLGKVMAGDAEHRRHFHWPVGKKGEISFEQETRVGSMMLKPGTYIMQHRVQRASGPGTAGVTETRPIEISCNLERLPDKAVHTTVDIDNTGSVPRVASVEIAEESVAHPL